MNWSVETLLTVHVASVTIFLAITGLILFRRGLFRWDTAGFWSWAAFCLYFVLSPLATIFNDLAVYKTQIRLVISGGGERSIWILGEVLLGITIFFLVYFHTTYRPITWKLSKGFPKPNLLILAILTAFTAFGFYSLLVFRAGLVSAGGEMIIEGGRFVGDITGYQYKGYMFLFVPVILLLLNRDKGLRVVGWILAIVFLILSLPHAWSRFATVSFLLAISITNMVRNSKRWPSLTSLIILPLSAMLFQLRGHIQWGYGNVFNEVARLLNDLPQRIIQIFSSGDTFMLQSWYVSSYIADEWIGYDYGLPLVNYVLTGWIPSRILPTKYFLIDWLNSQLGATYPAVFDGLLYGAKSSLLGSFYNHGGLIAVVIGSSLAGFLCRRLDGMLNKNTPILVKSVAIAWLSNLWMIWGSGTTWSLMLIGLIALPGFAVWLVTPKIHQSINESLNPNGKRYTKNNLPARGMENVSDPKA